jgi:hypothetical protein
MLKFTELHSRRPSKEEPIDEGVAAAISRFIQAEEGVTHIDHERSEELTAQTYAERRSALSDLIRWDEFDNVAAAIRRLVEAQQVIQDLYDEDCCNGADGDDFRAAYEEREAAIAQLITASKRPTVAWSTGRAP